MILISGLGTGGTLMCTFPLQVPNVATAGWCPSNVDSAYLDTMAPVLPWRLPPPDGKWYRCKYSEYGPSPFVFEPGFIQSSNAQERFKPCQHSTLSGYLSYLGPNEEKRISWRRSLGDGVTTYYHAGSYDDVPTLRSSQIYALYGNSYDIYGPRLVYDYRGNVVSLGYAGSEYQWHIGNYLPAVTGPYDLEQRLSQQNVIPYDQSNWVARNIYGNRPNSITDHVYLSRCTWDFADRLQWCRHLISEYHTSDSYTPASSLGYSKVPSTLSAISIETVVTIDSIRSVVPGSFEILYELKTAGDAKGWLFPSAWYGSIASTTTRLSGQLLLLEPGMDSVSLPHASSNLAKQFCLDMPKHIEAALDLSPYASKSRLTAMSDVKTLDSNWIENLSGLSGTFDVLNPLAEGASAIAAADVRLARNAVASAYLAYSYAVAPNISDYHDVKDNTKTLLAMLKRLSSSLERRRGKEDFSIPLLEHTATGYVSTTYYTHLKDNPYAKLWGSLERFGLEPSATKAWDLVTLSFVSDWFLDIGQVLADISAYNSAKLAYEVDCRIESVAVRIALSHKEVDQLFGLQYRSVGRPLLYKWYDRGIFHDIGTVNPFALELSSGANLSQVLQGSSLFTTIFL